MAPSMVMTTGNSTSVKGVRPLEGRKARPFTEARAPDMGCLPALWPFGGLRRAPARLSWRTGPLSSPASPPALLASAVQYTRGPRTILALFGAKSDRSARCGDLQRVACHGGSTDSPPEMVAKLRGPHVELAQLRKAREARKERVDRRRIAQSDALEQEPASRQGVFRNDDQEPLADDQMDSAAGIEDFAGDLFLDPCGLSRAA